jgi:hypothetical protein
MHLVYNCFELVSASHQSDEHLMNAKLIQVVLVFFALIITTVMFATLSSAADMGFPNGAATSSRMCGACHQAVYREFASGFGGDLRYKDIFLKSTNDQMLDLPGTTSGNATAHAFAGIDPLAIHARDIEERGESCNNCHFPQFFKIPGIDTQNVTAPEPRSRDKEMGGLTCACCHLTPEGKIRGPHKVQAPHQTVVEPNIQTSAMCVFCHSLGDRVAGKQAQTFLEWRDDFFKPGQGRQHCQDCHMPRTIRKAAEGTNIPERSIARHLWMGGRSQKRMESSLSLVVVQSETGLSNLEFHIINIGAGHSVPTGSNHRAIYLVTEIVDKRGMKVAEHDWTMAPWFGNRPDADKFLEVNNTLPIPIASGEDDAEGPHEKLIRAGEEQIIRLNPDLKPSVAQIQADSQGDHESIIRAGEERTICWNPDLLQGEYTLSARLVYDLDRFNDRKFTGDQTEFSLTTLTIIVGKGGKKN